MDATMLWPTPKNFVRSLRCGFDMMLWSQKQACRLLAPWLAPLFATASPRRDGSVGSTLDPAVRYAQEVDAVNAEIQADIRADVEGDVDADIMADIDAIEADMEAEVVADLDAVEAEVEADPDAEMAAAIATPADLGRPDDLTVIDGIGPKLAERLNAAGVSTFVALAAWQAADVERFETTLPPVQRGRLEREDWIGQARVLASAAG
jgi:predicted flap endonuclease-1-like 5' DNA nuclease